MPAFDFSGYSNKNYSSPTTSGGGSSNRESYRTSNAYKSTIISPKAKAKVAADIAKDNAKKFKDYSYQPPNTISPVVNLIAGFVGEKGFEVNKAYYTKNVIGKTNPVTGKAYAGSIEDFKTYMTGRSSGTLDAMGRSMPTTSRRDDRRIVTQVQKTAVSQSPAGPTDAEVSQSSSTDAAQDTLLVKKRGRRQTILTDPQGLGGTATVTKKKLLG